MKYVIIFRGKGHNRKGNAIIEADGWYQKKSFVQFWKVAPMDFRGPVVLIHMGEDQIKSEDVVAFHEHCIFSITPIEEEE